MPDKEKKEIPAIKMWSYCRPALQAGTYQISVEQKFEEIGDAKQNQHINLNIDPVEKLEQELCIKAPRFSLDPQDIHSYYPAHDAVGDFSNDLPYIVFSKQTLPWERPISPDHAFHPWLGLVLFVEGEVSPTYSATVENLLTAEPGIFDPVISLDDMNDNGKDSCRYIEIPLATFEDLLPRLDELSYLAHAREVDMKYKADLDMPASTDGRDAHMVEEAGKDKPGLATFSIVMANRFPLPGKKHIVHLVSLEGYDQLLEMPFSIRDRHPCKVRLISLASWSFKCTEDQRGFGDFVSNLVEKDGDERQKDAQGEMDDEHLRLSLPVGNPADDAVSRRLKQGYVPLPYHLMSGEESIAWCRGPLGARPETGKAADPPDEAFMSASSAMRFDAATGLFDQTYAVAWQLGRCLALADPKFGPQLMSLRRKAHLIWSEFCERLIIGKSDEFFEQSELLTELANKLVETISNPDAAKETPERVLDALLKKLDMELIKEKIDKAVDLTKSPGPVSERPLVDMLEGALAKGPVALFREDTPSGLIDLMYRIAGEIQRALDRSDHDVVENLEKQITILPAVFKAVLLKLMNRVRDEVLVPPLSREIQPIVRWINNLSLMDIPLNYLIPHPELLPPESLRFFFVDENWWFALFDGAVSLGIHSTIDEALYLVMRETVFRQWAAAKYKNGNRQWGLFLRSNLVKTWTGVELYAYNQTDNLIDPVLTKKIDEDLLLFLFEQAPSKLELREPKEGLRYGISEKTAKNLVLTDRQVLDIRQTVENMGIDSGNSQKISSAQFAHLLTRKPVKLTLKA